MRQTHTFLLTVVLDDGERDLHHGRVQSIADESEAFFRDAGEIVDFMRHVIERANSATKNGRGGIWRITISPFSVHPDIDDFIKP